jgi:hypothetical protein
LQIRGFARRAKEFSGFQVAMSGYGEHEGGHEHHHHKHHHESEREERREEEEQRHNINEGRRSHDNQGYGDEDHHGYSKSALRKEDVENLKHRTDISDEEKARRRRVLEGEIAAGVIGAGILGFAGYEGYVHYNKGHQAGAQNEEGEKKHHGFFE